ncbi:EF-hand domain [Macleaya cordata]|uniref:EF-hand domain n=1 Tax=Macleaya cordata TaxID=56857 RepID=A0A200PUH6_MACCD|nr:EF-hand domain [Macleaya cordata]
MGIRSFLAKRKNQKSLMVSPNGSLSRSPTLFRDSNKRVQEIEEVFRTLEYEATEEELKRMVEEVDSDGDGFIDLNEFIELNTIDSEKHFEDVKSAFSIMDADGDG